MSSGYNNLYEEIFGQLQTETSLFLKFHMTEIYKEKLITQLLTFVYIRFVSQQVVKLNTTIQGFEKKIQDHDDEQNDELENTQIRLEEEQQR